MTQRRPLRDDEKRDSQHNLNTKHNEPSLRTRIHPCVTIVSRLPQLSISSFS